MGFACLPGRGGKGSRAEDPTGQLPLIWNDRPMRSPIRVRAQCRKMPILNGILTSSVRTNLSRLLLLLIGRSYDGASLC